MAVVLRHRKQNRGEPYDGCFGRFLLNPADFGIIGTGSRVEHHEMAGYLTAISLAQQMGASEVVALLKECLTEEEGAKAKLRTITKSGELRRVAEPERKVGQQTLEIDFWKRVILPLPKEAFIFER